MQKGKTRHELPWLFGIVSSACALLAAVSVHVVCRQNTESQTARVRQLAVNEAIVVADGEMLSQLYLKLIGNAIKFAKAGEAPEILLTAQKSGNEWTFGVKDNGIGIDRKHANQVFKPFRRLHARGDFEGTGIGLAICRRAVERHGGRVWVESRPDGGAHFKFTMSGIVEGDKCMKQDREEPSFC